MNSENKLTRRLVRYRYPVLALFCGLLYLTNLGGYLLFDVDEPRYAETARQMIASGDYVVPMFNGAPRFEKPVLTYWLAAGAYHLFGVNEFAARLPSALCALGTVLLTCLLAGRLIGSGAGLLAGCILAGCLQFFAIGRMSLTDMPLTFFLTATLVMFALGSGAEQEGKSGGKFFLASFAAAGLAVLTKGPVGLLLPAAIIIVQLFFTGRGGEIAKRIPFVSGTAALCLIALPWYVLVCRATDFEFFRVFIVQHNFQRFFGSVAPGGQHVQPIYYYLPCLIIGIYPWSFFAVQSFVSPIYRLVRDFRLKRSTSEPLTFPLLWAGLVLVFFSLSRAKLPTYITTAFPPLAILISGYLSRAVADRQESGADGRLIRPALFGLAAAGLLAGFVFLRGGQLAPFETGSLPLTAALCFLAGPLAAAGLALRQKFLGAFLSQLAGQSLLLLMIALVLMPAVSDYRQLSQKILTRQACTLLGDSGTLAAYRYRKTALTFYSCRTVTYLEADDGDSSFARLSVPLVIITRTAYADELAGKYPGLERLAGQADLSLFIRRE